MEHRGEKSRRWDVDRLSQVIGNLVSNAFQHGPPDAPIEVRSRIEGARAEIAVHNGGRPIPEDDRQRLFAPFQRGSSQSKVTHGVGLGLYIAHAIVFAHGGTIDVTSTAAEGTCFTVRVPREASR